MVGPEVTAEIDNLAVRVNGLLRTAKKWKSKVPRCRPPWTRPDDRGSFERDKIILCHGLSASSGGSAIARLAMTCRAAVALLTCPSSPGNFQRLTRKDNGSCAARD